MMDEKTREEVMEILREEIADAERQCLRCPMTDPDAKVETCPACTTYLERTKAEELLRLYTLEKDHERSRATLVVSLKSIREKAEKISQRMRDRGQTRDEVLTWSMNIEQVVKNLMGWVTK